MRIEYAIVSLVIMLIVLLIMITLGSGIVPAFSETLKGFGGLFGL